MQQLASVHRDDHARLAGVRQDEARIFGGDAEFDELIVYDPHEAHELLIFIQRFIILCIPILWKNALDN